MKHLANDKPIVMKNMKKNQVGLFPPEESKLYEKKYNYIIICFK